MASIGIEAYRIQTELHTLLGDANYWVKNATYPADEIAIRFHHRLVATHPFPNGNGRHARLMADLLIEQLGGAAFSWGGGNLRHRRDAPWLCRRAQSRRCARYHSPVCFRAVMTKSAGRTRAPQGELPPVTS
jgi:fido (protein-threonine AMPylation protein)